MLSIPERAAAYLERMPPAIAGSGGHVATFNAAAVLTRGFALPMQDAWPLLTAWNLTHCQPPWSEAELRHKLTSAAASTRPLGSLLEGSKTLVQPWGNGIVGEDKNKANQRLRWPTFEAPTSAEMQALSRLRTIPESALRTASEAGLLHTCRYEQAACFILSEGDFAQARRLDGLPLPITGGLSKAKNLPGSKGAFIGAALLGEASHVLLVEGCIGLLEALGCIALADAQDWTAIAATSASSRWENALHYLPKLKGRHVRILPDADPTGLKAAKTWLRDLEKAGCRVDARALPPFCKDLGPILTEHPAHSETLHSLFQ